MARFVKSPPPSDKLHMMPVRRSTPPKGKQTVLVTGAAGFIGSHAAEAMIERGYEVIGVDNFCDFYDRSWKELNVKCVGSKLRLEEIDITDRARIHSLIAKTQPAAILHLAAM